MCFNNTLFINANTSWPVAPGLKFTKLMNTLKSSLFLPFPSVVFFPLSPLEIEILMVDSLSCFVFLFWLHVSGIVQYCSVMLDTPLLSSPSHKCRTGRFFTS